MATDTAADAVADAVAVAASSSSIETNQILSATNIVYPYFFMTVTNYPNLLQHVNQYQPINMVIYYG